ncbi:MAG TPA: hypothetical protein VGT41_06875 [Candidatus Babeliales bacterium]|nr:hypothetical protein [Candidatus Babeliales bacterium]
MNIVKKMFLALFALVGLAQVGSADAGGYWRDGYCYGNCSYACDEEPIDGAARIVVRREGAIAGARRRASREDAREQRENEAEVREERRERIIEALDATRD